VSATGWFAGPFTEEEDPLAVVSWQPVFQDSSGCYGLPRWFDTQEACEKWLAGALPGLGQPLDFSLTHSHQWQNWNWREGQVTGRVCWECGTVRHENPEPGGTAS